MRYRAVAVGVEHDGHPVQFFAQEEESAIRLAQVIADQENVPVQIFRREEKLIGTVDPKCTPAA
jgi:hypothetical protein